MLLHSQQFLALENINCILNFCLPADKQLGDSSQQIYNKMLLELSNFRLRAKRSSSEVDRVLAEVFRVRDSSGTCSYSESRIDGLQADT